MHKITLIKKDDYTNIHPFPRRGGNDKIALWGPLHGGNLSLKNELVAADPALRTAFDALGAQPWPTTKGAPHTTPHGGPNFHGTLRNITLAEAMNFFRENGYEFMDGENEYADVQPTRAKRAHLPSRDEPAPPSLDMGEVTLGQLLGSILKIAPPAEWYDALLQLFKDANRFQQIQATSRAQLAGMWPDGVGVYVVRRLEAESILESILYIGMTGTLDKDLGAGGRGFKGRMTRYTPYCYSNDDHFKFGPNASGEKVRQLPANEQYKHHYPLETVVTDCFVLTGIESEIAPSLLESILLQMYVSKTRNLPPANNEF
jgi:hypothetical protein